MPENHEGCPLLRSYAGVSSGGKRHSRDPGKILIDASSRTAGMACDAQSVRSIFVTSSSHSPQNRFPGVLKILLNRGRSQKEACSLVSGEISSRGMWCVINRRRECGCWGKTGNSSNKRQIMSVREGFAAEKGAVSTPSSHCVRGSPRISEKPSSFKFCLWAVIRGQGFCGRQSRRLRGGTDAGSRPSLLRPYRVGLAPCRQLV